MQIVLFSAALIIVAVIRIYLPSEEEVKNPLIVIGIVIIKIIFWLIQILLPFLVFYLILEALFEVIGRIL
jgi:hypothetical protein